MFWTITGWLIALLSLIVNILQLRENRKLKGATTKNTQSAGDHSKLIHQTHSGHGDNINVAGKTGIRK